MRDASSTRPARLEPVFSGGTPRVSVRSIAPASSTSMRPAEPIFTVDLFPELHETLLALLNGLSGDDWSRPTAAGHWTVRDAVAHLLDGDMRQLSFRRDVHPPSPPPFPIESYADVVRFIDGLTRWNASWVKAFQRVSPRLLVELHALTGLEVARVFRELDPFGSALFGVAWAGEHASTNWFDTAREFTERWHHQQQVREAVGAEPITRPDWLHPVWTPSCASCLTRTARREPCRERP